MRIHLIVDLPTRSDITAYTKRLFSGLHNSLLHFDLYLCSHLGLWYWKLLFGVTGRCGSLLTSHTPVYGNLHSWLWQRHNLLHTCSVCGEVVKESERLTHVSVYSRVGREADVAELNKLRTRAKSETAKRAIDKSIYNINHEDKRIKSMREELIKATRNQDHATIKEIHGYVAEKKALQQHEK